LRPTERSATSLNKLAGPACFGEGREIGDITYQNKAVIYDLLFKASAETTITIVADPKHLGARIGFMSVLHTWGSALTHHPHVHMIVPGDGLSPDGSKWIACRPRYFLTVQVLSALFRRLFRCWLRPATPSACSSSAIMRGSPTRLHSRPIWRHCASGVMHPAWVLFKPNDRGEFVDWDARHVDGALNGACVSVTYRHATGHYLAIVDG
jgi:hypothetical protein